MCFFSATLHSPAITKLAADICFNPTWVDLKGKDSIPESVHHVVVRVDPLHYHRVTSDAKKVAILDGVHVFSDADRKNNDFLMETQSKMIKEMKLQTLIHIIDKFEVGREVGR